MGNCVGGESLVSRRKKKSRKRRRELKKWVASHFPYPSYLPRDRSFNINPTFHGSSEEAWFDPAAVLESDRSDDDFQSLPEDVISESGSEGTSVTSNEVAKSFDCRREFEDSSVRSAYGDADEMKIVFVDEILCSARGSAGGKDCFPDNCGLVPNTCLPCLVSEVPPVGKRSLRSNPSVKKKVASKHSFKSKEGASLFASKELLMRPVAGSQVAFCPFGKQVADSWSDIEPRTFKVRAENYFWDKRKESAANHAAYNPFGVDVFLCQRKIEHIARFVELPAIKSSDKLASILVVNVQIPLYPTAIFNGETDGEGISVVLYFKLAESLLNGIFQENIRRLMDDEMERVKGFHGETAVPFRDRLKILGRVANVAGLPLSTAERKLMHAYNEKPVLSRPQHDFYSGEDYFEIDLDMHRFSYISRKGFEAFLDRLKFCVLDFGLTIQGNKSEELPEQMLCCIRLNEIDYANYRQLQVVQ